MGRATSHGCIAPPYCFRKIAATTQPSNTAAIIVRMTGMQAAGSPVSISGTGSIVVGSMKVGAIGYPLFLKTIKPIPTTAISTAMIPTITHTLFASA